MSFTDLFKHFVEKLKGKIKADHGFELSEQQIIQAVCAGANILANDICPVINPPSKAKHGLGCIKQKPDSRDFKLSHPIKAAGDVPVSVDLRPSMPPIYDQGQLGSCVDNATGGSVQYLCMKDNYKWKFTPSRLFLYYNARALEGTVMQDAGSTIRDGFKALNSQGICPEAEGDGSNPNWLWPYSDNQIQFRLQPPSQCYKDAVLHGALKYESVPLDAPTIKSLLADAMPVVFGINVYDSFESQNADATGVIPMPNTQTESLLGGHALLFVGYLPTSQVPGGTDPDGYFIFRNSWGTSWGAAGYGYIPQAYVTDPDLASDFWCLQLVGDIPKAA